MTETEKQILKLLSPLKPNDRIEAINNVSDYIRAQNRKRITEKQYGRIVDERWDELNMKHGGNATT
jgi:hypothetical protein